MNGAMIMVHTDENVAYSENCPRETPSASETGFMNTLAQLDAMPMPAPAMIMQQPTMIQP
ncbi:hypothetical protein SDC9_102557 [bioreactor metagenome]|uniref:Uncharacterized protein n=1 Tax=bioreactor metagenome TaxID=1076179 RepID=A0A645ARN4_9ZZZZ